MNNKARIITKHDTTANWNAAVDFIPMKGEVIIYDDYQTEPGWENIYNEFDNPLELGAIASATGQDTLSRTRVRTHGYVSVSPNTEYVISSNIYQVFILEYNHSHYLNIFDGWKTLPYTFTTASNCTQIRLVFANADNSDIFTDDVEWLRVAHQIDVPTPNIKVGDGVRPAPDLPFIYSEVDPTVPNWAKQATKPGYDASEISFESININPIIVHADDVQEAISVLGDYVYLMTPSQIGAVPTSRKVNGHALTSDVNVTAADVGAVPTSRKVNGHALTSDVNLAFSDLSGSIDARDVDYTPPSGSIYGQADNVDRALEAVDTYLEDLSAGAVAYEPSSPSTSVFGQATDVERALDNLDTYMAEHPIPSKTSDLTNDSGFLTGIDSSDITGALGYIPVDPSVLAPVATSGDYHDLVNTPTLAGVATSGDYYDLVNIPTLLTQFQNDAGYITRIDVEDMPATVMMLVVNGTSAAVTTNTGRPINMSTFMWAYNSALKSIVGQILNTPQSTSDIEARVFEITEVDLPNATVVLTAVEGGVIYTATLTDSGSGLIGTFSSQTIPTATSDLTNDSGFITSSSLSSYMQKGVDYVTAGQLSGTTLGAKATAEGHAVTASGNYSHAEGYYSTASGNYSHAEGYYSTAAGSQSHAEGNSSARGLKAHAEGNGTSAQGDMSHTEGVYTMAVGKSQHVFGEYNIADSGGSARGTYVEIVGNGTALDARSNARTLDWSGNEVLAGKLTVGAAPTNAMDVATKQYVDGAIPTVPTNVSSFTNDAGYLVASDFVEVTDAEIHAIVV